MDIEVLKEQWSEVEDRDGVRLSWNVFPSSRMVSQVEAVPRGHMNLCITGSLEARCPYWRTLYPSKREAGFANITI